MSIQSVARAVGRRWSQLLDIATALALIGACVTVMWTLILRRGDAGRPTRPPSAMRPTPAVGSLISLEGAPTKGSRVAKLVVVEYADFQCTYCARFAQTILPELDRTYVTPGRILFAFRHLPLRSIHPQAQRAAQLAECSARQGKFWEMHDLLFMSSGRLDEILDSRSIGKLGLDMNGLNNCLGSDSSNRVQKDGTEAATLGISGTPTFLIGSIQPDGRVKVARVVSGMRTFKEMQTVISEALTSSAGGTGQPGGVE